MCDDRFLRYLTVEKEVVIYSKNIEKIIQPFIYRGYFYFDKAHPLISLPKNHKEYKLINTFHDSDWNPTTYIENVGSKYIKKYNTAIDMFSNISHINYEPNMLSWIYKNYHSVAKYFQYIKLLGKKYKQTMLINWGTEDFRKIARYEKESQIILSNLRCLPIGILRHLSKQNPEELFRIELYENSAEFRKYIGIIIIKNGKIIEEFSTFTHHSIYTSRFFARLRCFIICENETDSLCKFCTKGKFNKCLSMYPLRYTKKGPRLYRLNLEPIIKEIPWDDHKNIEDEINRYISVSRP